MPTQWKDLDAQSEQELENYKSPIPSRLLLIQMLMDSQDWMSYEDICKKIDIASEQKKEALLARLNAMVRDNQLIQSKKGLFKTDRHIKLLSGEMKSSKDGSGVFIPDDGSEQLVVSSFSMQQYFDQDRVIVKVNDSKEYNKQTGQIIALVKRQITQLVGCYFQRKELGVVIPENKRIRHEIIVKKGALSPSNGQYVLVEIIKYPSRKRKAEGVIKKILGDYSDAGVAVNVALHAHEIPSQWSKQIKSTLKKISEVVTQEEHKNRIDLRKLPFVTIDGDDSRDFDDAVFCTAKKSGGWRLYVAIADVSHYVKVESALDIEAKERGTSVYFPNKVIPMLPEVLSNGICSLNEGVDRLVLICEMTISDNHKLSGYTFYEGLICSHARLTYNTVASMVEEPLSKQGKVNHKKYKQLSGHIAVLYDLSKGLREKRTIRGAIDFDTIETKVIFNEEGKVDKITPIHRNEAHKLIEECMLLANISAARFLEKNQIPAVYRVHQGPTDLKKQDLIHFLSSQGLSLPKRKLEPLDLQKLIAETIHRPSAKVIQTMVLKSMGQAIYTTKNEGHFGLAYNAYTHFTSPIRRYPDLLVHRAIRKIISAKKSSGKKHYPYKEDLLETLAERCSVTERRADSASRDVLDWLKCEYTQQFIGQTFFGTIATVTAFGIFVVLDDIYIEGLIHITNLLTDYYHFDPKKQELVGKRTGRKFELLQSVEVVVNSVNMDIKKIDFLLAGFEAPNLKCKKDKRNLTTSKSKKGLKRKYKSLEKASTPEEKKKKSVIDKKKKSTSVKTNKKKNLKVKSTSEDAQNINKQPRKRKKVS